MKIDICWSAPAVSHPPVIWGSVPPDVCDDDVHPQIPSPCNSTQPTPSSPDSSTYIQQHDCHVYLRTPGYCSPTTDTAQFNTIIPKHMLQQPWRPTSASSDQPVVLKLRSSQGTVSPDLPSKMVDGPNSKLQPLCSSSVIHKPGTTIASASKRCKRFFRSLLRKAIAGLQAHNVPAAHAADNQQLSILTLSSQTSTTPPAPAIRSVSPDSSSIDATGVDMAHSTASRSSSMPSDVIAGIASLCMAPLPDALVEPVPPSSMATLLAVSPSLPHDMQRPVWCLADFAIKRRVYKGYASSVYLVSRTHGY